MSFSYLILFLASNNYNEWIFLLFHLIGMLMNFEFENAILITQNPNSVRKWKEIVEVVGIYFIKEDHLLFEKEILYTIFYILHLNQNSFLRAYWVNYKCSIYEKT